MDIKAEGLQFKEPVPGSAQYHDPHVPQAQDQPTPGYRDPYEQYMSEQEASEQEEEQGLFACCKGFFRFLLSHVGLCLLVILYCVIGMALFFIKSIFSVFSSIPVVIHCYGPILVVLLCYISILVFCTVIKVVLHCFIHHLWLFYSGIHQFWLLSTAIPKFWLFYIVIHQFWLFYIVRDLGIKTSDFFGHITAWLQRRGQQLLLAKVRNASGRIGIFLFVLHSCYTRILVVLHCYTPISVV